MKEENIKVVEMEIDHAGAIFIRRFQEKVRAKEGEQQGKGGHTTHPKQGEMDFGNSIGVKFRRTARRWS